VGNNHGPGSIAYGRVNTYREGHPGMTSTECTIDPFHPPFADRSLGLYHIHTYPPLTIQVIAILFYSLH
jgi:hypothetical protein